MSHSKIKTLIIGCDYLTLHSYWRYYAQSLETDIIGFVYCGNDQKPINRFKGVPKIPIRIIPLRKLESVIRKKRVQRCDINIRNMPMPEVDAILHRIIATGSCSIRFVSPPALSAHSMKPLIVVNSISSQLGKSQLACLFSMYFANANLRVGMIMPLIDIETQYEDFDVKMGPHYVISSPEEMPKNVLSQADEWQIPQYFSYGAHYVFVTSDIRRGIIQAEQECDIIIIDSKQCDVPLAKSKESFCVVSNETLSSIRKKSNWPGLLGYYSSKCIVLNQNSPGDVLDFNWKSNPITLGCKLFYFSRLFGFNQQEIPDLNQKKVMLIGDDNSQGMITQLASSCGSIIINPQPYVTPGGPLGISDNSVLVNLPRCASPTQQIQQETSKAMDSVTKTINKSSAEVVIVAIQNDVPNVNPDIKVIYATPQIVDQEDKMKEYLSKYFTTNTPPPLQSHFEAQVDILMAMGRTSDKEIVDCNHSSANRNAIVKLFLESHLPPGFRVTSGEIKDSQNNTTNKLGVVVVNEDCPRLTIDGTGSVHAPIIADSVLAVIEVKQNLNQDSLKRSLAQLRPVKALMPNHSTLSSRDGKVICDPLGGKIVTGIIAFSLIQAGDIEAKLPEILNLYPNVVDFVVVLDSFGLFSSDLLHVCGFDTGDEKFVKYYARGSGLAMIFGIFNAIAATRRFNGSNYIQYLNGKWSVDSYRQNAIEAAFKAFDQAQRAIPQNPTIADSRNMFEELIQSFMDNNS